MSDVTRLELELDDGQRLFTGRLRTQGGRERSFHGWLGLISALDAELGLRGRNGANDPPNANDARSAIRAD
jgi:hypothetical protein